MAKNIVIVGAGQAAVSCAARLRALSPDCSITVVGDEPYLPYQRPPLSKGFLSGELATERLALRPKTWYESQSIALKLGVYVKHIDRDKRIVTLANSEQLPYDRLVLATGSRPRTLPQSMSREIKRIYTLRGIDDAQRLKSELRPGQKVLVVGGGYVGLEFAASAAKAGLEVVIVEAGERILGRVSSAQTADYFRELHRSHGVEILEGVALLSLCDNAGTTQVSLSNGTQLNVDFTVVGIGALANDQLAMDCGLETQQGILIDEACQTSDPLIFAAGDCATMLRGAVHQRIESVQNAMLQGETAAYSMLGLDTPPLTTPWFWSDQYDTKLQIAGLHGGYERTVLKAGARPGAQSVWYYAGEKLLAVEAINDPVTYMTVRRMLDA